MLKTPVLLLIFNRPDTTEKVFEEIKKVKPQKLFVAADGPRIGNIHDIEMCEKTRSVIKKIDWDCELKTLFRSQNLGCRKAVVSAIDWFFDQVSEGIILEDDCLPNESFFSFCQKMLHYYQNDSRIMHISGSNLNIGDFNFSESYYFSQFANIWGWATWKRAWNYYDVNIGSFPEFYKRNKIYKYIDYGQLGKKLLQKILIVYNGHNTWAFQWSYTCIINNGLAVTPIKNLISNIGFGENSTLAYQKRSKLANIVRENLMDITHPQFIIPNRNLDKNFLTKTMKSPSIIYRISKKLKDHNYNIFNLIKYVSQKQKFKKSLPG